MQCEGLGWIERRSISQAQAIPSSSPQKDLHRSLQTLARFSPFLFSNSPAKFDLGQVLVSLYPSFTPAVAKSVEDGVREKGAKTWDVFVELVATDFSESLTDFAVELTDLITFIKGAPLVYDQLILRV